MFDIEKSRKVCAEATLEPWQLGKTNTPLVLGADGDRIICDPIRRENAEFIVYARTTLPEALNELEAAQSENERLQRQIENQNQYIQSLGGETWAAWSYSEQLNDFLTQSTEEIERLQKRCSVLENAIPKECDTCHRHGCCDIQYNDRLYKQHSDPYGVCGGWEFDWNCV